MFKKLLAVVLAALMVAPVPAWAQISIPHTFAPFTTIQSSQVNANFDALGDDALDRTGGTMTGNLTLSGVSILGTYTLGGTPTIPATGLTGVCCGTATNVAVLNASNVFTLSQIIDAATPKSLVFKVSAAQKAVFGLSGSIYGDSTSHASIFAEASNGIRFDVNGSAGTVGKTGMMHPSGGFSWGNHVDPGANNFSVTGTGAFAGAVTGGTYNGQTISASANFTGTLAVSGAIIGSGFSRFTTGLSTDGTDPGAANFRVAGTSAFVGAITVASIANSTGLAAGTWTPTITNTTNVDSSTAYVSQYLRVGNTVTVSLMLDIDPTAGGGATTLIGISLPVASDFTAIEQAAGGGWQSTNSSHNGRVLADITNNRATYTYISNNASAATVSITFTYLVV